MFLLDTHVVTQLRRREQVDAGLAAWASGVAPADLFLSAISLLELEMGLMALENHSSPRAPALRDWLDSKVLPAFAGRILPIDAAVARRAAALHVPLRRPERSALLGATAIVHGLTVVTQHPTEFDAMGVGVFSPWNDQHASHQGPLP